MRKPEATRRVENEHYLAAVEADPEVLALYKFGSRVHNRARPDSDLDLAVMLSPALDERAAWNKRLKLGSQLAAASPNEVDLSVLGEDLDLTFRILKDGQRIYERDRSLVRAREARLIGLYYDYQPFLENYLAKTAEHFRNGG